MRNSMASFQVKLGEHVMQTVKDLSIKNLTHRSCSGGRKSPRPRAVPNSVNAGTAIAAKVGLLNCRSARSIANLIKDHYYYH